MAHDSRPYSVKSLAAHWGVSENSVRNMITAGDLTCFRLGGKLIRIRAAEVERVECQGTDLLGTGESSLLNSEITMDNDGAVLSARATDPLPKPALVHSSEQDSHR